LGALRLVSQPLNMAVRRWKRHLICSSDAKPLKIRLSLLGASGHVIREVIGTSAEGGVEVGRPGQGHVVSATERPQ